MELEEFDLSINRAEKKEDKIYYVILIQYKELKYEINKRFSDFEMLQWELLHFGFSALPMLPPKKLLSYTNTDYINFRKRHLNSYIQILFSRPDVRCSSVFLNFLNFYDKFSTPIDVIKTKLINSICPQKFSLSDFYINEKANFIICVYEDRSNLSKLGKLWSIIEPDILGQIKLFTYNNDVSSSFTEKFKIQTFFKGRNIVYEEMNNLAVISGDDGNIHIYKVDVENLQMVLLKSMSCHNDAILCMMQVRDTFCTCGYDNAFRLFRLRNLEDQREGSGNEKQNNNATQASNATQKKRSFENIRAMGIGAMNVETDVEECETQFKIISGGRCNKRLEHDKLTTCHLLEYNNIILGTDNSLFFMYNMTENPPTYLDTKKIKNGKKINCFANTDKYLFIGHDHIIACYNYRYVTAAKNNTRNKPPVISAVAAATSTNAGTSNIYGKMGRNGLHRSYQNNTNILESDGDGDADGDDSGGRNEKNIKYIEVDNNICAQYISTLTHNNKVLCMCVNKSKKILYAGYEDAIILWSIVHGLIISAFHAHTCGVYCLQFLNDADCLISGGNGGNLKIWKCKLDNYQFWKPRKKNVKTTHDKIKYKNNDSRLKNDTQVNQNNFYFDENDYNINSEQDNCSSNSDAMSIDSLLNHNGKPIKYEIYDTSNYKKDILSHKNIANANVLNNNATRESDIFPFHYSNNSSNIKNNNIDNNGRTYMNRDNIKENGVTTPTLPLFDPGKNTQEHIGENGISQSETIYDSFTHTSGYDIFETSNLKSTEIIIPPVSTNMTNPSNLNSGVRHDSHDFTFDDVHHMNTVEMTNEKWVNASHLEKTPMFEAISENISISQNATSQNAMSQNAISQNAMSQNVMSPNVMSPNVISQNAISHNESNVYFMEEGYQKNQMEQRPHNVGNEQNSFYQKEQLTNLKKNIVYASDEDDEDSCEDLIGAFN